MLPILTQRLEQPREQASAHHLVLEGFWVLEKDGLFARVGTAEPFVGFVVRAEDEGEGFYPTGVCELATEDVTELVDGQRGGYCIGCREAARQVVEAIRYCYVFHEVALVEDVGARGGDRDLEDVFAFDVSGVAHAFEELDAALGCEGEAGAAVDVAETAGGDARR